MLHPNPIGIALVLKPFRNFPEGVEVSLSQIVARTGLTADEVRIQLKEMCDQGLIEARLNGNYRLLQAGESSA